MKESDFNNALNTLIGTNAQFQIQEDKEIWISSASHSVIESLIKQGFNVSLQKPEGYEEKFLQVF